MWEFGGKTFFKSALRVIQFVPHGKDKFRPKQNKFQCVRPTHVVQVPERLWDKRCWTVVLCYHRITVVRQRIKFIYGALDDLVIYIFI